MNRQKGQAKKLPVIDPSSSTFGTSQVLCNKKLSVVFLFNGSDGKRWRKLTYSNEGIDLCICLGGGSVEGVPGGALGTITVSKTSYTSKSLASFML